ncbi:hypothetical protein RB597_002749 [Gaeumannomyces tritici]
MYRPYKPHVATRLVGLLMMALLAAPASAVNGKASFYGGNLAGGNCLLTSYTLPAGIFGTAIAGPNYESSGMCGVCLNVKGPKGSMKAMVVDSCPGCPTNQLDLFQNGFPNIGDRNAGVVPVSWDVTPCGIKEPLKVRNKDGTSRFWFAMQVFNSDKKVTALDVSTDGGRTWQPTARRDYNFFEKPGGGGGFGADAVTVRVTCAGGGTVTMQNVGMTSGATFTAAGNC